MNSTDKVNGFALFLAGVGVGAILALLFAPKTGKETREMLGRKAQEGKDYATAKGGELRQTAEDLAKRGRKAAEDFAEKGRDLVEKVMRTTASV